MTVTLDDVRAAQRRIAGGVAVSPCPESIQLSELCGARIFCKLDYLQRTGSFKERGARNALLLLDPEQPYTRRLLAAVPRPGTKIDAAADIGADATDDEDAGLRLRGTVT